MHHKKLFELLVNFYSLYLNTHVYHWNIEGSSFLSVHKLFEKMYQDLIEDVDSIAERMRILGDRVEISFDKISSYSSIKAPKNISSVDEAVRDTIDSIKKIELIIVDAIEDYEEEGDFATVDLLTQKLSALQKNRWFLTSSSK